MTDETVKIPAQLWQDIKNKLAPHARKLMDAKGMFEDFPDLYDILSRIRDFEEFHSPNEDAEIYGILTSTFNVDEAVQEPFATKEPEYVSQLPEPVKGFYDNLPTEVKDTFNAAIQERDETFSTDALFETAPEPKEDEKSEITNVGMAVALIYDMFQTVKEKGAKKVSYRSPVLTLSAAPDTGANPGMIYIKDNHGDYVGKMNSKGYKLPFQRQSNLTNIELDAALLQIANDPKGVAVRYGRMTGNCCLCGLELTDPQSVANGIGPICSSKFGW